MCVSILFPYTFMYCACHYHENTPVGVYVRLLGPQLVGLFGMDDMYSLAEESVSLGGVFEVSQWTQGQLPTPFWCSSQPPVTPNAKYLMHSSGLHRHPNIYDIHTYT